MIQKFSLVLFLVFSTSACARLGLDLLTCVDVDCSGHGTCGATAEGEAYCSCDPGYCSVDPLTCKIEPCDGTQQDGGSSTGDGSIDGEPDVVDGDSEGQDGGQTAEADLDGDNQGLDGQTAEADLDGDTEDGGASPPRRVGALEIGWAVHELHAVGGNLYVACSDPDVGLRIYDLSDPTQPTPLGSANTAGPGKGIFAVPPYVYFVGDGMELEIFDASDPGSPSLLGSAPIADIGLDVDVEGDFAYVVSSSNGDDLEIFDISDPYAPTRLGGIELLSSYSARGVDAVGTMVYVAAGQLHSIDASNPEAPVALSGGFFYWYGESVVILDSLAFAIEENNNNQPQLRVFDISDPADIQGVSSTRTSSSYPRDIALLGSNLYAVLDGGANGPRYYGIEVFDITDSSQPTSLAFAPLTVGCQAVTIDGTHAFVGTNAASEDGEVVVFDLTTP